MSAVLYDTLDDAKAAASESPSGKNLLRPFACRIGDGPTKYVLAVSATYARLYAALLLGVVVEPAEPHVGRFRSFEELVEFDTPLQLGRVTVDRKSKKGGKS